MKSYQGRSVSELWRRLQHSSTDSIRASARAAAARADSGASLPALPGMSTAPASEEERQLHALALELAILKRRR